MISRTTGRIGMIITWSMIDDIRTTAIIAMNRAFAVFDCTRPGGESLTF
ncbi:MAG: hypothetical protein IPO69_04510 [Saprospiraceae bacterium]|nr:hypothetical protein [Saprospiraceae bacterium]